MVPRASGEKTPYQAYLTDSAVPSGLYMMLAFIAGVNKAVLALGMQLH